MILLFGRIETKLLSSYEWWGHYLHTALPRISHYCKCILFGETWPSNLCTHSDLCLCVACHWPFVAYPSMARKAVTARHFRTFPISSSFFNILSQQLSQVWYQSMSPPLTHSRPCRQLLYSTHFKRHVTVDCESWFLQVIDLHCWLAYVWHSVSH